MTTYILILVIGMSPYTNSSTAEFNNLQSCEKAIAQVKERMPFTPIEGICVQK